MTNKYDDIFNYAALARSSYADLSKIRKKDDFELKSVDYKTFGENISELMKNVYGVYLADTGYSNLIDNIFNKGIINSMTDEEKKELEEAMGREAMIKYKLLMSKRQ